MAEGLKEFYKIGPNLYIDKKEIKLNNKKLKEIKEFVNANISQGVVLLPLHIKDFSFLPDINCTWSPWLLCEIVKDYGLGFTVVKNKNIQKDNLILGIVTNESKIKTKDELFRWLIKNDYNGSRTKNDIIKYARKTGLFGNSFTWEIIENMLQSK